MLELKPACAQRELPFSSALIRLALPLLCSLLITGSMMAASAAEAETLAMRQAPDLELKALLKKTVNEADSFYDRFDAEVWLVDMSKRLSRYIDDPQERMMLLKKVHAEARKAGLEPELVMSLIHVESAFQRFAISSVGAQGLMQVMPFWKNEIGRPDDNLMDLQTNLRYGCTILKHYIDKEKGNLIRALARYNGSLGRLKYPEKVMRFWEQYWFVKHV
jgi:soluble lytic murein transglycosylase-like protein